jgi:C4-dicarboxylate-specific signal transduction histidine kinase
MWASAQWRQLFGFSPDERLQIDQFVERLHPDDRDYVCSCLAEAAKGAGHYEVNYRVVLPDRQVRWIASRGRVEFGADGRPALMRGVTTDVTQRHQAELELQRQRTELAHLSRVSVLGELAGALAHELNQPLTAILSNAQVARQMGLAGLRDEAELGLILEDIKSDARRAGGIIHGLRAMFRKDGPTGAQPMDLNDAVVQTLELLNSEIIARKVKLVLQLGENLPPASAGRVEIQQVLINLVLNALDALKSDALRGLLEIATEHRTGWLQVTVRDNGPGIPEAMKECLFDPFVTSKSGGLGLGLAISRSIADRYRGKLEAETPPEGGALFRLTVPVAETSFA